MRSQKYFCHNYIHKKYNNLNNVESSMHINVELKLTDEMLGNTVLIFLKEIPLNSEYCIIIGTDEYAIIIYVIRDPVQI